MTLGSMQLLSAQLVQELLRPIVGRVVPLLFISQVAAQMVPELVGLGVVGQISAVRRKLSDKGLLVVKFLVVDTQIQKKSRQTHIWRLFTFS